MRSRLVAALALSLALAAGPAAAGPRLVLVLVVDQLRPDRIGPELPGGIGRLLREGRVFSDAVQDIAFTETCPGHATVLTGRHPARTGIPANAFFDPERSRLVYCVEDPAPETSVFGVEPSPERIGGRSPRLLRADTLGDWMRAADARSRVVSVSGKDRAAILLAGKRPDGAWWFVRKGSQAFTTSGYYRAALPAWVARFNDPETGFLAGVPEHWEHAEGDGVRADDFAGESPRFSRTSPHPLRRGAAADLRERLFTSPFLDEATLAFALALVEEEGLGRDETPDLLAVALSATDVVGHAYGPFSLESRDALRRLDLGVGRLLEALERRVGEGGLLAILTADHGVLALPEWLEDRGTATCPVEGGRVDIQSLGLRLLTNLHLRFSPLRWPRRWLLFAGSQLAVNAPLARERGVDPGQVAAATVAYLEAHPAVAKVWSPPEIRAGQGEIAQLYRNSFDPERSGDLAVQVVEGCLVARSEEGTSHGSPYLYDRRVPLVFWGAGVEPGRVTARARTVDIAPTLAARLGVPAPADLDGRPLFR